MRSADDLDPLRGDGSWDFTWRDGFIDKAVFRLAKDTREQRRALVERLVADLPHGGAFDLADAEQWEAALIDFFLSHPAADQLRELELHLTDYHHSAEAAAAALARRPRPRLATMYFGHSFDTLFELHETSTGNRIDPEDHLDAAVVRKEVGEALWNSLPALRTLELEGTFLFGSLSHDGLTHLRTRGAVFADGSLFSFTTPALTSLEVEIGADVHGVVASAAQLKGLEPARFPHLRSLDLSAALFEADEAGDFAVLAQHPLLPQLEKLSMPTG
jgi:hypothetical protein